MCTEAALESGAQKWVRLPSRGASVLSSTLSWGWAVARSGAGEAQAHRPKGPLSLCPGLRPGKAKGKESCFCLTPLLGLGPGEAG